MSSKIPNIVGYHISPKNATLCCKERHTLLLEHFLTSIRHIRMFEDLLIAYPIPLWSTQLLFYQRNTQISSKITSVGTRLSCAIYVILCLNDIHTVLLDHIITSLRYIRLILSAFDSIADTHMINIASFLPKKHSNFKQNKPFPAPDHPGKRDTVH